MHQAANLDRGRSRWIVAETFLMGTRHLAEPRDVGNKYPRSHYMGKVSPDAVECGGNVLDSLARLHVHLAGTDNKPRSSNEVVPETAIQSPARKGPGVTEDRFPRCAAGYAAYILHLRLDSVKSSSVCILRSTFCCRPVFFERTSYRTPRVGGSRRSRK